jgi:acetyltransferase-like isoleucine patch superfamily enzyme
MMLSWMERRFGGMFEVVADRLRAAALRARGARLGDRARLGKNCVVRRPWCLVAGDRIQFEHQVHIKATDDRAEIRLGREVFVGFNCEFDISQRLTIGNHVLIAPGCFITDHTHLHEASRTIAAQGCVSAPVRLEDDVWLGAHVIVLPGVTVGRGAIVAAGAVVNADVAPMTIVGGVPARVIGARS